VYYINVRSKADC